MKKIFLVLLIGVCSCSRYSPEVEKALEMAGKNREELVKVLEYYQKENNKEKIKASEFLISNLPYNYSYDTTNLNKYNSIYSTYDSLKRSNVNMDITSYINKYWDSVKVYKDPYGNIYSKPVIEDIKVITSDFLIKNIDMAYTSWKLNLYSKDSVSFDDFCEYILPYRQIQGKAIENWREYFQNYNKNHFNYSHPIPFTKACDSLFEQYKNYKFNYGLAEGLPILKFKDFMKIKEGKCTLKSWFNTYLVNAEGIPMVADFVPAWGHREDDHQWNALIYGGKTLYFESFWEKNHSWMYNVNINNNLYTDDWAGKIRLPKVFRHTFSTHMEGPISDKRLSTNNIPPLFRNVKKKDVSHEYFNAVDVTINLNSNLPKDTYFAYLCVLGVNKQWIPIQWGKIDGNTAVFRNMGTDIVYQAGYYKNGSIIPFGNPFHLDHDGKQREFIPKTKQVEVIIKRKYPAKRTLVKDAHLLNGALIQASNRKDFKNSVILQNIDFNPELRPYDIIIKPKKQYRYYRIFSKNKITVKEIELLNKNSKGEEITLNGKIISSIQFENDTTYSKIFVLEKAEYVSKFKFTPPNNLNHVLEGLNYELFYISEGNFISLGRKVADSSFELRFDSVPKDALLYLKCLDEGRQERIFEYKNDEQIWY